MCARKTFDMALHRSTLCSPTIRHMPTIQNHGEFLTSAFIFHSQFSIFNYATANIKQKDCPSGQSFLQQRQLSIREIYNFQSALLGHMHGLRGTA